jgi:hypothetical protein
MSAHKQQNPKQGKSPENEAAPSRREDRPQERTNKSNPRGSMREDQNPPIAKRSDQEDFEAPTNEKRDQEKARQSSEAAKRQ